ncbi:MAG: hypothetical protein QNI95_18015 [Desulfobacterales bacterium]|nr:hypothetical protein [Desulfobacterales bacterium]
MENQQQSTEKPGRLGKQDSVPASRTLPISHRMGFGCSDSFSDISAMLSVMGGKVKTFICDRGTEVDNGSFLISIGFYFRFCQDATIYKLFIMSRRNQNGFA